MRKFSNILFLMITLSFFVFSTCKKDNDDDGISTGDGCTATWKVNGTDYSSELELCVYLDSTLNLSTNLSSSGDFLLQVDPITVPGTYVTDPNDPNQNVVIILNLNDGTTIVPVTATVNVTELSSTKAKGTFSGEFADFTDITFSPDFSVTDGSFEVNF